MNVTGITTRALIIDDDGTWTTRTVTMKDDRTPPRNSRALTKMFHGPDVINDTHACLAVGVIRRTLTPNHHPRRNQ